MYYNYNYNFDNSYYYYDLFIALLLSLLHLNIGYFIITQVSYYTNSINTLHIYIHTGLQSEIQDVLHKYMYDIN